MPNNANLQAYDKIQKNRLDFGPYRLDVEYILATGHATLEALLQIQDLLREQNELLKEMIEKK